MTDGPALSAAAELRRHHSLEFREDGVFPLLALLEVEHGQGSLLFRRVNLRVGIESKGGRQRAAGRR